MPQCWAVRRQTELLDWMGVPVGASDTHNGVTITADAIIGDAYSYAVVYSIVREDGQPLVEDLEPLGNGVLPLTFDPGGHQRGGDRRVPRLRLLL